MSAKISYRKYLDKTGLPPEIHVEFVWMGEAIPAPRMTQSDKWKKPPRDCVARYWAFRDSILLAARQNGLWVGYQITQMDAVVYLPIPKSSSKKLSNQPHGKKPDLDNLCKSILDALSDGDQTCWSIGLEKRYDDGQEPRIELRLVAHL